MSDTYLNIVQPELAETAFETAIIKVVGVGGGGGNAVNYIYKRKIAGVSCAAINTDAKSLQQLGLPQKLPIAKLGSGADPAISKKAAEEHEEEIKFLLKGSEMAFITAGMGKGTGTGASPVIVSMIY